MYDLLVNSTMKKLIIVQILKWILKSNNIETEERKRLKNI
jgi:hypothetical protein